MKLFFYKEKHKEEYDDNHPHFGSNPPNYFRKHQELYGSLEKIRGHDNLKGEKNEKCGKC